MSSNRKVVQCTRCGGDIQPLAGREVSLYGEHFAHQAGQCTDSAARAAEVTELAQAAGFAWQCSHVEPSPTTDAPVVCDASGWDPAEFTEHMRSHGVAQLKAPDMIRLRPSRTPSVRAWTPKQFDPGQRMTWWRDSVERQGVIWSDGPYPRSYWVTPDGESFPALVVLPTPKRAQWGDRPHESLGGEWAQLMTRRANNVLRHGSVFAVLEGTRQRYGYNYGRDNTEEVLSYHVDPECQAAAGKERRKVSDWRGIGYDARRVLAIVTGRESDGCSPSLLCKSCVWLEPAAELVNA